MSDTLTLLPYGPRAVLVELTDADTRRALVRWLDRQSVDAVDVVAAETTVLLDVSDPLVDTASAQRLLHAVVRQLRTVDHRSLIESTADDVIPTTVAIRYDGPDLQDTARTLGLSVEAFVDWHTKTPWTVEFLGFIPGFTYLTRHDHQQIVERRPSPRRSVPAGSVGLAGPYCGIYPRSSPGGWQLIGHTEHALFDSSGAGATFAAGDLIDFRPIR